MARAPAVHDGTTQRHTVTTGDLELRQLVPRVLSVLVRRGGVFAAPEHAGRGAPPSAPPQGKTGAPPDPTGWLIPAAWRAFLDMPRSDSARRDREVRFETEPPTGAVPGVDDTLQLYFL